MDSLQRAREMYEAMDFSNLYLSERRGAYTMADGKMKCEVICRNDKLECLHCTMEPDTLVEEHTHEQTEHYLLYTGDITLTVNKVKTCLQHTISPTTPPLTPHTLESKRGAKLLIARIPASKGKY